MAVLGATNLTGCNSIPDFIAGGSLMTFQQTSAPTSWTKQTTHDNKALRVVTGTATPGGSTAFTTVFASRTPTGSVSGTNSSGSVSAHTLATPEIPTHNHNAIGFSGGNQVNATGPFGNRAVAVNVGASGSHTHGFTNSTWSGTFTGTGMDFAVQYVDVIIASKN
jgi:hypothetical protein